MKVAICFSGQIRTFEECWPSYSQLIEKYNCDLFAATPPNKVLEKYPFKSVIIQKDRIIPDKWYNLNHHPKSPGQNMLSQFWFIQLANNVRIEYEKRNNIQYDFIFRTRFDNLIIGDIPDLSQCDPNQIYIPEGHDHPECSPGLGISDRFAFGGNIPINAYSNKFDEIEEYMSNTENWYFAEVILKWALVKHNIQINRFPETVKIKRPNGDLV